MEAYFNNQLKTLLEQRGYDPCDEIDRQLLGYVFIPVLQTESDKFLSIWNSHRIREQANMFLTIEVPEQLFNFPGQYGGQKMGIEITNDQLQEVAEVSGVLDIGEFINKALHKMCQQHLPHPENLAYSETMNAYLSLKERLKRISIQWIVIALNNKELQKLNATFSLSAIFQLHLLLPLPLNPSLTKFIAFMKCKEGFIGMVRKITYTKSKLPFFFR